MAQRSLRLSLLALALLAGSACDEEAPVPAPTTVTADAGTSHGSATAEAQDAGTTSRADAGAADAAPRSTTGDAGSPPGVDGGNTPAANGGPTPASTCGRCASHEFCDPASSQCLDKYQPWQLDCAHLPASTTCQGGPREVLLVAASQGAVAMFDPEDGHFLGFFSRQDLGRERNFVQAAQGPDQCVYLLDTTTHELARWSPDGVAKGTLQLAGSAEPQSFTFTADSLYLASDDQISRLTLDGKLDAELALTGRQLLVGRDGSFLVRQRDALLHLADASGTQEPRTVLAGLAASGQVAYTGDGYALLAEYGNNTLDYVELETGASKRDQAPSFSPFGIAQLGNGKRLFTGMGTTVASADPGDLEGATDAYATYAIQGTRTSYIGRACLREEFVAAQQPAPAVTDCSAPTGPTLFAENFDDGNLADWTALDGAAMWTVKPGTTSPSLSLGVSGMLASGTLQRDIGATRPHFVSYRVRVVDPDHNGYSPEVSLHTVDGSRPLSVGSGTLAPDDAGWFEVQVRDIDWTAGTFDVYTVVAGKCERVSVGRSFEPGAGNLTLALFEDELAGALLDDIVIK
jgi:hypothetical protein